MVDLLPKLDIPVSVGVDPFPTEVKSDAECKNDHQRDDRSQLVNEGREHEGQQDYSCRRNRDCQDYDIGPCLGTDPEVSRSDERENQQGDGATD